MSEKQKLDVIDMIINTLREHERKLDEITSRLENLMKDLDLRSWT